MSMRLKNAGVDLLNSVPLEEADMGMFRQVIDVNIMAAVYVRTLQLASLQLLETELSVLSSSRRAALRRMTVYERSDQDHEGSITNGGTNHQ